MKTKRAAFHPDELEVSYEPHYFYRCIGCYQDLRLAHGDPRVGSGTVPRCARCGSITAPVHPDEPPVVS